ncbi:MAG: hypothetical protein IBX43_08540 [Campylobacterales bacterium]|nr:hypothetical protein [Campylobacterales bacterium]
MKPSRMFYLKLYLFWAAWVSIRALLYAAVFSLAAAAAVYALKGFAPLHKATFLALREIVLFSFPVAFSLSFIVVLLLVFRALFVQKIDGFRFELDSCAGEKIEKPLLSDVTGIWRKWLFITIWVILIFMVLFLGLSTFVFGSFPPLSWLNGWSLYLLVMTLGGAVFVYVVHKCTKIKIRNA